MLRSSDGQMTNLFVPVTNYEQFGSINERATHEKLSKLSLNGRLTGCVPVTVLVRQSQ